MSMKDVDLLEWVQRAKKIIKRLDNLPNTGWGSWARSDWRREGSSGDSTAAFQFLTGPCEQEVDWLFTWSNSDSTRRNSIKLQEWRFTLYVRRKFFAHRLVGHWNKQPAQRVVGASALGAIKARLDWPWATSPQQGAGNSWALKTLPTQAILWLYNSRSWLLLLLAFLISAA